jgi:hypothetical protein
MTLSAPPADHLIVSTTFDQQTTSPAPAKKNRWWQGMTLDQQDEHLDKIDPETFPPGQPLPMSVGKWNREKRRVRRGRERWMMDILALRTPCQCKNCRDQQRPPFPRYYVVNQISYECWLEEHAVDHELEEFLIPLRNDRKRAGSAFVGRGYGVTEARQLDILRQ